MNGACRGLKISIRFWLTDPMTDKRKGMVLLAVPVLLAAACILFHDAALYMAREVFPPCSTYVLLGIYCPGCGLTRCILALMEGNVILALRCNGAIVCLLLFLVLLYAEWVFAAFGREVKLLPRKIWFWIIFAACAVIYFILRNYIPLLMPPVSIG